MATGEEEKGVLQDDDDRDWVAPTGGEVQEFSIAEMTRLLRQVAQVREERAKSDVLTVEQLIAKAQQLETIFKQGEEQVAYFTTRFELNPPDPQRDQTEINLLEQLRTSVAGTEQALLETNQQIGKLSSQPDVMGHIQDEAEVVQRSKEKYREIEASIDQIKQLLEKFGELFRQSDDLTSKTYKKGEELGSIRWSAERRTNNEDILTALANLTPNNWSERSGQLENIRKGLGMFKGRDKAIIDDCLKRYPAVLQEYDQLEAWKKEVSDQIKETRKQAESLRKNLIGFMFGTGQDKGLMADQAQRDHLNDKYRQVVGKDYHDRLSYDD